MDGIKFYLTYEEYEDLSLTSLSEEEFDKCLPRATIKFDILTDYMFSDKGIDNEQPSIRRRLKVVNALLVENESRRAKIQNMDKELKSFKMGDTTQTRFTPQELGVLDVDYPEEVLDILRGMGLLRLRTYGVVSMR